MSMRIALFVLALSACAPRHVKQTVWTAPTGLRIVAMDAESSARWNTDAEREVAAELDECVPWLVTRQLDVRPYLKNVRVELRTFATQEAAGPNHAELSHAQLIKVNWLAAEDARVVGRLICHETGHIALYPAFHHAVMRAMSYAW